MRIRKKLMKKTKLIFMLLVTFLILGTFSTTVFAERLGTGKISGGARNILYWRDNSIYEYRHSVDYGFDYWNGHLSTVSLARTDTKSYSRCDVYWGNYFAAGSTTIAQTYLILNNQVLENYNVDWYWCQIKFNMNKFNYTEMPDYAMRKATACHEYGHFLGLAHPPAVIAGSIMQKVELRATNVPTSYNFNWLIQIYGQ